MAIIDHLEFSSLPCEDAALRAIFSQITAEIRKRGLVLNGEDGSFYVSKRFKWKSTVKDFFDAYHKICERKQVHPIYQESILSTAFKVPYASIETIHLIYDGVVKHLMQFKKLRIPTFSKLPDNLSTDDLVSIKRLAASDKDICRFIDLVLVIDEELREYVFVPLFFIGLDIATDGIRRMRISRVSVSRCKTHPMTNTCFKYKT